MTRESTKEKERIIVLDLIRRLNLSDRLVDAESPDFILEGAGRQIGVEVTLYQSKQPEARNRRRSIAARWRDLEIESQSFRNKHPEMAGVLIVFFFKDKVPTAQEQENFFDEILEFIRKNDLRETRPLYLFGFELSSPLMMKYIQTVSIGKGDHSYWTSNKPGPFIDPPSEPVSRIIREKSQKAYEPLDELWLVIRSGSPNSDILLPDGMADEVKADTHLMNTLFDSVFSRVYMFTAKGLFQWTREDGVWTSVPPL